MLEWLNFSNSVLVIKHKPCFHWKFLCLLCTTCNEIKYTISPNFIFVFCQFVGGFIPFHMILPANIWGEALCSLLQHIPHFSMYIIHCLWSHMFALFFQTKKNYIWQDLRNFGLPSSDQICLKSNDSKKNFHLSQYKKKYHSKYLSNYF